MTAHDARLEWLRIKKQASIESMKKSRLDGERKESACIISNEKRFAGVSFNPRKTKQGRW